MAETARPSSVRNIFQCLIPAIQGAVAVEGFLKAEKRKSREAGATKAVRRLYAAVLMKALARTNGGAK